MLSDVGTVQHPPHGIQHYLVRQKEEKLHPFFVDNRKFPVTPELICGDCADQLKKRQYVDSLDLFRRFNSLPWLENNTILLVKHGSQSYGTHTPTSDLDVKGVAIPPRGYFLGYSKIFEQAQSAEGSEIDIAIYDIRKFFKLAADCNPNIIEVLWTDPENILHRTQAGDQLLRLREKFLSKKAKFTFTGYAIAQLKRIQTHRRWLLNPPTHKPTRAEYGLPEQTVIPSDQRSLIEETVKKRIQNWEPDWAQVDDSVKIAMRANIQTYLEELQITEEKIWLSAARIVGVPEPTIEVLKAERAYQAAINEYRQYENWKATRNEVRHELEAKYGYDTKHAMHLVRLMRMCREILTEGTVKVRRPDAQELLSIRYGAWSYDKLMGWAQEQDLEMQELYSKSTLRHHPDVNDLTFRCQEIVEMEFSSRTND
jgi:predicted nucleotidyltransferase